MSKTAKEWVYTLAGAVIGAIIGFILSAADVAGMNDQAASVTIAASFMAFAGYVIARQKG